jgi:hypothetical protein
MRGGLVFFEKIDEKSGSFSPETQIGTEMKI